MAFRVLQCGIDNVGEGASTIALQSKIEKLPMEVAPYVNVCSAMSEHWHSVIVVDDGIHAYMNIQRTVRRLSYNMQCHSRKYSGTV